jgi:hypothetical protein
MEPPPELLKLAQGLNALHSEGVAAYRPVVEALIARREELTERAGLQQEG